MSKFCTKPFDHFEIDTNGNAWMCCMRWLPLSIGNVNTESIEEITRSVSATEIRKSILDGSFRYCDHDICPELVEGTLPDTDDHAYLRTDRYQKADSHDPKFFALCNDESCNLSCPSCRINMVNRKEGEIFDRVKRQNEKIFEYVKDQAKKNRDGKYWIHITGSGDPFAAKSYRDVLFNFDGREYPNIKINLQTNGVMLTEKYWGMMEKIHNNLHAILISFDAATEETYNIVRRGGDWKLLNENTRMVAEKRSEGIFQELRIDYVVQDHNYKEMPLFVELMDKINGVDEYHFQKIIDWGTYQPNVFEQRAIWQESHPEHEEFLKVLHDRRLRSDKIKWGNVAQYFNKAHTV